jgi:molecular chaperone DnaJ
LKIPAGTQSGRIFRVRGEGIADVRSGRRGDEIVEIVVTTPTKLSSRQKELLAELGESLDEDGGGEGGIFGKIKDRISDDG